MKFPLLVRIAILSIASMNFTLGMQSDIAQSAQSPQAASSAQAQPQSWWSSVTSYAYSLASGAYNVASTAADLTRIGVTTSVEMIGMAGQQAFPGVVAAANQCTELLTLRNRITASDTNSHTEAHCITSPLEAEKPFIEKRSISIQAAFASFLGEDPAALSSEIPSFGICFSGGGMRAMYETLGWLRGAEKAGILPIAHYATGLSGSTWALNGLIASGLSLDAYTDQVSSRLAVDVHQQILTLSNDDLRELLIMLGRKYYDGLVCGPVDLYGAILSHLLLKGLVSNHYQYPLSALKEQLNNRDFPFIISTAVLGQTMNSPQGHAYRPTVEFSPLLAGCFETRSFIPIWSLGYRFNRGISQPTQSDFLSAPGRAITAAVAQGTTSQAMLAAQYAPDLINAYHNAVRPYYGHELPLGFIMGMCGSAFSVDMHRVLLEFYTRAIALVPSVSSDVEALEALISQTKSYLGSSVTSLSSSFNLMSPDVAAVRSNTMFAGHYIAARLPNFHRASGDTIYAHLPEMEIVDGGHGLIQHEPMNLAIMPLLHRKMNVIAICDSSADIAQAPSLRSAEKLARSLNLKFPRINYEGIESHHVSLFIDEDDLEAPIVIYMPCIANREHSDLDPQTASFAATTNFTYTQEQAKQLMGLIEHNVMRTNARDVFKFAFKKALERKKRLMEAAASHAAVQATVVLESAQAASPVQ